MIKNLTAYGAGLYSLQLLINNEVITRKLVLLNKICLIVLECPLFLTRGIFYVTFVQCIH